MPTAYRVLASALRRALPAAVAAWEHSEVADEEEQELELALPQPETQQPLFPDTQQPALETQQPVYETQMPLQHETQLRELPAPLSEPSRALQPHSAAGRLQPSQQRGGAPQPGAQASTPAPGGLATAPGATPTASSSDAAGAATGRPLRTQAMQDLLRTRDFGAASTPRHAAGSAPSHPPAAG